MEVPALFTLARLPIPFQVFVVGLQCTSIQFYVLGHSKPEFGNGTGF